MKKTTFILIIIIVFIIAGFYIAKFFGFFASNIEQGEMNILDDSAFENMQDTVQDTVDFTIEEFASGLYVPWSLVFTSPNRVLVAERSGHIRIIQDGKLLHEPLHIFTEISTQSEEGLMGLIQDPQYAQNKYLYACMAYPKENILVDKVVRFTDQGNTISDITVILDDIPAAPFHAGCELQFGPDDKLYITTGDATQKELAQDVNSLAGKILRINVDGSIPEDNPFQDSPVYALGVRNTQGIDWHPMTHTLFATDHGPSLFDGPAGGDEVNIIIKGGNYGWPLVSHEKNKEGLIAPKIIFTPAIAPASGLFYSKDIFPQLKNNFLFSLLKGEGIMRVVVSEVDPNTIIFYEKLNIPNVGRIREITEGPDGYVYFTTSNRDGRGQVRMGDDKVYRIIPR